METTLFPTYKTPRPYQHDADIALWNAIDEGRAFLVMATGLGKTVQAALFARRWYAHGNGRTLFMAHTVDILRQARAEFQLALGGAVSTGIISSHITENVDADVLFITFQSLRESLKQYAPDEFDLVIVDEAHHGVAFTYRNVIEYFTPDFLLGMTATPDRTDGMDVRELFGEETYSYPLARALADGEWLAQVDYRLQIDNIDIAALKAYLKRIGEGDRTVSRKALDSTIFLPEKMERIAEIVSQEQRASPSGQTIIFCRSRSHIRTVAPYFPGAIPYHSGLSPKKQGEIFDAFRSGEISTLLVVNKFNEGVDIPNADLLVFLRATDSPIVWLQQLGRGMRGDRVTVLDFVANCDRIAAVYQLGLEITKHTQSEMPEIWDLETPGFDISFAEEIIDVVRILQRLQVSFYETWEEASTAAKRLGITSASEYKANYRLDPMLPSSPNQKYESVWEINGGWIKFLSTSRTLKRRTFYSTWEEASTAAKKMGITSQSAYRMQYRQDPLLPSSPNVKYKDVWTKKGKWPGFLGSSRRTRHSVFYPTWEEASAAAQQLGFQSSVQYRRGRRADPLLHSTPQQLYADVWTKNHGWDGFLGKEIKPKKVFYSTWEEASAAAQQLGLKSQIEYTKRYKEDPHLPSTPKYTYANVWKIRGGWRGFLGKLKK